MNRNRNLKEYLKWVGIVQLSTLAIYCWVAFDSYRKGGIVHSFGDSVKIFLFAEIVMFPVSLLFGLVGLYLRSQEQKSKEANKNLVATIKLARQINKREYYLTNIKYSLFLVGLVAALYYLRPQLVAKDWSSLIIIVFAGLTFLFGSLVYMLSLVNLAGKRLFGKEDIKEKKLCQHQ